MLSYCLTSPKTNLNPLFLSTLSLSMPWLEMFGGMYLWVYS